MFKESKFIFEHAEFVPSGRKKPKLFFEGMKEYDGGELPKEIQ